MAAIKYKDPSTNLWEEVGEIIKGKDAAYVGSSAPTDPQYTIWVDTSETGEGLVTSVNGQVGAVTLDTVHVGSSSPTDPNIDIWLDTDEQGQTVVTSVNGQSGAVTVQEKIETIQKSSSNEDYIINSNNVSSGSISSRTRAGVTCIKFNGIYSGIAMTSGTEYTIATMTDDTATLIGKTYSIYPVTTSNNQTGMVKLFSSDTTPRITFTPRGAVPSGTEIYCIINTVI